VECGCEIVKYVLYHSFTASEKLGIIEEDKTEIGLLEENWKAAKIAYVFDEAMNKIFFLS
jgi:hypothetical protein